MESQTTGTSATVRASPFLEVKLEEGGSVQQPWFQNRPCRSCAEWGFLKLDNAILGLLAGAGFETGVERALRRTHIQGCESTPSPSTSINSTSVKRSTINFNPPNLRCPIPKGDLDTVRFIPLSVLAVIQTWKYYQYQRFHR